MVNIRVKGASEEREVADALNYRASLAFAAVGVPFSWKDNGAQRNQLQTAVGGCDLTQTWGLAIEIKRQEQLSINTWWAQCEASANRLQQEPVLIFKQSRVARRVIMYGWLMYPNVLPGEVPWKRVRTEITWEAFLDFYQERVRRMLIAQMEAASRQVAAAG